MEKIDKLDFIKIKNFCSLINTVKRRRTHETSWENLYENHIFNKELEYKTYKPTSKLVIRKQPIKNEQI